MINITNSSRIVLDETPQAETTREAIEPSATRTPRMDLDPKGIYLTRLSFPLRKAVI